MNNYALSQWIEQVEIYQSRILLAFLLLQAKVDGPSFGDNSADRLVTLKSVPPLLGALWKNNFVNAITMHASVPLIYLPCGFAER